MQNPSHIATIINWSVTSWRAVKIKLTFFKFPPFPFHQPSCSDHQCLTSWTHISMNIVVLSEKVRFPTVRPEHNALQTQKKTARASGPEGTNLWWWDSIYPNIWIPFSLRNPAHFYKISLTRSVITSQHSLHKSFTQ